MNKINNISFGRHKIPRHVYHFTNKKNYDSMLKDGFIKLSDSDPYLVGKGIFILDLQNYFKHWGFSKDWYEPLYISLLREVASWRHHICSDAQKLIILKIPTGKLDISKLKIRSQNKFFRHKYSGKKLQSENINLRQHLSGQTPAYEAKKYTTKKEAIEYIYQDDIPIDIVEQIGNIVDIPLLKSTPKVSYDELGKTILQMALKDTNEAKGLHLIKN